MYINLVIFVDKMYCHKIHENLKLTKINIHTVSIKYLTNAPYNAKIIMSYPANFMPTWLTWFQQKLSQVII